MGLLSYVFFRNKHFSVSQSLVKRNKKAPRDFRSALFSSVGEKIRTPDLLVRSQTLYPAELRPHIKETLHGNVSFNAANRNRTGTGV